MNRRNAPLTSEKRISLGKEQRTLACEIHGSDSEAYFTGPRTKNRRNALLTSVKRISLGKEPAQLALVNMSRTSPRPSVLELVTAKADLIEAAKLDEAVCDDPDDDKFFACAIAGDVNIIISGDKHLLKMSGNQGIEVVRPRQFVEEYLKT